MLYYEHKFRQLGRDVVIGVDEAGRGPLAGPVVAAAVYLQQSSFKQRIDDSKKLSASQRDRAFFEITSQNNFGVGIINERVIDRLNILVATRIAMEQALEALFKQLSRCDAARMQVLVDGPMRPSCAVPCAAIIGGDGKSQSIAAASIIAKVVRDRIMCIYDRVFPGYGFVQHKGYPTQQHRSVLARLGRTPIHRMSFMADA
ncbi:MAG TPA: ribonuclease HII [Candidatus Omnitrophota bacterium]|nr:ribonuclease HII [Candidatus Omnitrophota bacterium]HRZ14955.1 ribonuclease HII [Candidatus Omnitrophota bacterium]